MVGGGDRQQRPEVRHVVGDVPIAMGGYGAKMLGHTSVLISRHSVFSSTGDPSGPVWSTCGCFGFCFTAG